MLDYIHFTHFHLHFVLNANIHMDGGSYVLVLHKIEQVLDRFFYCYYIIY